MGVTRGISTIVQQTNNGMSHFLKFMRAFPEIADLRGVRPRDEAAGYTGSKYSWE